MSAHADMNEARRSEICREHYDAVFRLCLATLRCEHDASDATQLTFERVLRRLHELEIGPQFDRYVLRTARFACIDVARARKKATSDATEQRQLGAVPAPTRTDAEVVSKDTCDRILGGLDEGQRDLLIEREMLGHAVSEMARRRDRGARSLSVSLHRARRAAAEYAIANDLRSLLPLGILSAWCLRVRNRLEQAAQTPAVIAAAGLVALSLSSAGPAVGGVESERPSGHLREAVSSEVIARAPVTHDMADALGSTTESELPSTTTNAVIDGDSPTGSGGVRLPVDRVTLPGPGGTVHQDRPDEPTHQYGIAAADTEVATVETDEEGDELSSVDEPLCSTVGRLPGGSCASSE